MTGTDIFGCVVLFLILYTIGLVITASTHKGRTEGSFDAEEVVAGLLWPWVVYVKLRKALGKGLTSLRENLKEK